MKTLEHGIDESLETILHLEETFNEVCEFRECKAERTHLLACPKCPALENLCEAHTNMIKAAGPRERIMFDRTCNHNVPMVACGKIRVGN